MPEKQVESLSNEKTAELLESIADDFETSGATRRDLIADLVALLSYQDEIIVSDGPLRDDGRMSFGHRREGMRGVGLFLPANPVEEAVETRRSSAD